MTPLSVVSVEDFALVDEHGGGALLGDPDDQLIAEGSDVMVYGDGGAGKTTLMLDGALHLAAGQAWLGVAVARPLRVLWIENEGPRPQFRRKVRRKLGAWSGPPLDGRLTILAEPWAALNLTDDASLSELAKLIRAEKIDVLIAGPLTRLGMTDNGTLAEVAAFSRRIASLREQSGRSLAVILIHHASKAGAVSGAWEGAADTLLHVEPGGTGQTLLHVQKARWSASGHGRRMRLRWTPGEGFEAAGATDTAGAILSLQADGEWRTAAEIAKAIGGRRADVENVLRDRGYPTATGADSEALGRSPKAILYGSPTHLSDDRDKSGRVDESGSQGRVLANPTPRRGVRGGTSGPDPRQSLVRPTDDGSQR